MPPSVCTAVLIEHDRARPLRCTLPWAHSGDHNGLDDGGSVWWAQGSVVAYRLVETIRVPGGRSCTSHGILMGGGLSSCSLHEGHVDLHFDAGRCLYWDASLEPLGMCKYIGPGYYSCTRAKGHQGLHAYLHEPTVFWDAYGRSYGPGEPLKCQKGRSDGLLCELPPHHTGDHKNTTLGGGWASGAPKAYEPRTTAVRSRAERRGRRH